LLNNLKKHLRLSRLEIALTNRKMATAKKITGETDYKSVMAKIEKLMSKGSENVSKSELAEIRKLALEAQQYEQSTFTIAAPTTLVGIIEMKMYEMRLKQKDIAKKLKVSDTKLSLIMNGKQKPDIDFLKAVHKQLHINGDFLLNAL
jgi:HTH-type transcriptional regulator/antitoxin HigA